MGMLSTVSPNPERDAVAVSPSGRSAARSVLAPAALTLVAVLAGSPTLSSSPSVALGAGQDRTAPAPRPEEAAALEEFEKRLDEYASLHGQLSGKITRLSKEATPADIDKHERALATLIENARRTSRRGDLFTPAIEAIVRRELTRIFSGADGRQLRSSIMDENPVAPPLRVNERYPDTVPMATMPPEVLAVLPPLPKILNYRFVGDRLVLLDTEAHIIADFVDRALPGAAPAPAAKPSPKPAPGGAPTQEKRP